MRTLLVALAFLTTVPIRFRHLPSEREIGRSRFWYPVVGSFLGFLLGLALLGLAHVTIPPVAAFLVLIAWVVLTGALHLDGLADTCDGLFAGRNPEERLKIMRDPHVGTFGIVGCILVLLGKGTALQELARRADENANALVVGMAGCVGVARCCAWFMAALSRYARAAGTGKAVVEAASTWEAALATLGVTTIGLLMSPVRSWHWAAQVCGPPLLVTALLTWICYRRLGGATGDSLGMAIELAELSYLLAWVA
jgi:adenosylcobinamide-GDP ribazoletransferase